VILDRSSRVDRAARLREEFDRSFAEAPRPVDEALLDLLTIRVGATPYALQVAELSGLVAGLKITRVPSDAPDLIGVAGVRGSLLAVYDLRILLGQPANSGPRWVAMAGGAALGVAFDSFEAHVRVSRAAVLPCHDSGAARHVREVVQFDGLVRPIISLGAVVHDVRNRLRAGTRDKE
jgi:chemotaxis signal transduction protein